MKKTLLSLALVAALPTTAFADISVYGRANVSVDLLDDGADYSEVNMSSNSSRLGFKASKDFDGITGFAQIEQEIDFSDSGAAWASRDTFVGVKGGFGSFRFGKFDTAFKAARGPANLFGDQLGDMRNITRVGNARFDERMPNAIEYQTNSMGGLKFTIGYSLHEGTAASYPLPVGTPAGTNLKDTAISLAVGYKSGAFDFAAAYEAYEENYSRGERDAFRVAAAYSLSAIKFVGFYQMADHDNDALDSDVMGVGAEYKLGKDTVLRGHYLTRSADPENADSDLFTIGIENKLGSDLRIYANYAMMSNDDGAALTPWAQARTTNVPGAAGETSTGLSAGLRFDF